MRFGIVSLLMALVLMALGLVLPWIKTIVILGLCYGLAALGVAIPARAGQVSFGHAMFACVSAYIVAFFAKWLPQMDGILLIACGVGMTTLFAAILGIFMKRYRGIFFGMLNLAVSMVIVALLGKLYALTGGSDGIRIERPTFFGWVTERHEYETLLLGFTLLVALGCGGFYQRFIHSACGQALAGLKTNETRLEYLGLSAQYVLWQGYVISAVFLSLAGAIFALAQGLVTPDLGSWTRSGEFVFIMILGGVSHALGAFVGAGIFEVVKLVASAYMAGVWQLLLGVTLLVVIAVAPQGIMGALAKRLPLTRTSSNHGDRP
jgi:ABC-type branched-subunit amino acid transport system permease subunit